MERVRRGLRRSPDEIAKRAAFELRAFVDRFTGPPRARVSEADWDRLRARPFPLPPAPELRQVRGAAALARARVVDLLGSGPTTLGDPIDWHLDFKSGLRWPLRFFRDLDLNDLRRASDVKVPWELSRLQWLLPLAQEYRTTRDERDAAFVRDVLMQWIQRNPYAWGVNWGIAMEPAMRILTWTALFHVFAESEAWQMPAFRRAFLQTLYRHAVFCRRYLEDFGAGGNHLVADATGLVFAGAFFGEEAWSRDGWGILNREIERQVTGDGVDFEGSLGYHRFVADLFRWAARIAPVSDIYAKRLAAMDAFTAACTGPDGEQPRWGDDDDGKALPLDSWAFAPAKTSHAFEDAGIFILAGPRDHVFVDCGPAGFAHGHNDILSFEAVLDDVRLLTDSGNYAYTSSAEERNRFRSAAAHNAPVIDGAEPNPFAPGELFRVNERVTPRLVTFEPYRFVGSYDGLEVRPTRSITLDPDRHELCLRDEFEGEGTHRISVALHIAPGLDLTRDGANAWRIGGHFRLALESDGWEGAETISWYAPRYGMKVTRRALVLTRDGPLATLALSLGPS